MINSVVIVCEESPIGKNSAMESVRMAAGILAVGDVDDCKLIFMGDAVYFLTKKLNPEILNMGSVSNIMRLMELSDLETYVLDTALDERGLDRSDLIDNENVRIAPIEKVSELISNADMTFRY